MQETVKWKINTKFYNQLQMRFIERKHASINAINKVAFTVMFHWIGYVYVEHFKILYKSFFNKKAKKTLNEKCDLVHWLKGGWPEYNGKLEIRIKKKKYIYFKNKNRIPNETPSMKKMT